MYLNQLNYWRVTITPFILIRLIMPPTLWSFATSTQMFRACIYSRNLSLGRFKNPIEISEQFVLSHANLLYLSGMYYRGNV